VEKLFSGEIVRLLETSRNRLMLFAAMTFFHEGLGLETLLVLKMENL
jgi:hypothetical protein